MRGERWVQPRERTGRDVGNALGDGLRGCCLGVPRGKVVRAGVAQLNSWPLLRRWGGGRETDTRQREGGKREKHTGLDLLSSCHVPPHMLPQPKARASHMWPHGVRTHLVGVGKTPKLPSACSKHTQTLVLSLK